MGMYDVILVPCPECGVKEEFQTKSGECSLRTYELENCPVQPLADANRHSPYICECGNFFEVDLDKRKAINFFVEPKK